MHINEFELTVWNRKKIPTPIITAKKTKRKAIFLVF